MPGSSSFSEHAQIILPVRRFLGNCYFLHSFHFVCLFFIWFYFIINFLYYSIFAHKRIYQVTEYLLKFQRKDGKQSYKKESFWFINKCIVSVTPSNLNLKIGKTPTCMIIWKYNFSLFSGWNLRGLNTKYLLR